MTNMKYAEFILVLLIALGFAVGGWYLSDIFVGWYNAGGGISLNKDIFGIRAACTIIPFFIGFLVGATLLDRFQKRF